MRFDLCEGFLEDFDESFDLLNVIVPTIVDLARKINELRPKAFVYSLQAEGEQRPTRRSTAQTYLIVFPLFEISEPHLPAPPSSLQLCSGTLHLTCFLGCGNKCVVNCCADGDWELSREFVASLLAHSFLSTFPLRTFKSHPTLQDFNRSSIYRFLTL